MAILPDNYRLLIKQDVFDEKDEVYQSAKRAGLQIVHDRTVRAQESVDSGVVVSLGPKVEQTTAKVGDKIVFAKHSGKQVEDPEDKDTVYVVINDDDVVAILKG
jgi:co-chaperonin GroES (HSP10)